MKYQAHNKFYILLIEDTKESQRIFKAALSSTNCLIDIAVNGKTATQNLLAKNYHLVVLDINLPDCDGISALESFESSLNNLLSPKQKIPLILFTNLSDTSDYMTKLKYFVLVDSIQKPIGLKELKKRILNALKLQKPYI